MKKVTLTLCVVHKKDKILLGMKKRGFGEGLWNGFGGKVGESENIIEAAHRELHEETGITPKKSEKCGLMTFEFPEAKEILEVHIFSVVDFDGVPKETEEMKPVWFSKNKIPYHLMWPDDEYWLPILLLGKKFEGRAIFGPDNDMRTIEVMHVQ